MCASYGLESTAEDLDKHYAFDERGRNAAVFEWLADNLASTVRPTGPRALNLNPLVRERMLDGASVRRVDLAWWQLWVGGQRPKFSTINARSENLMKGAWVGPTKSRRALVPATYYNEKGRGFGIGGGLFSLAAIYSVDKAAAAGVDERAGAESNGWVVSYAIVTKPAEKHFEHIHDRMPMVVDPSLYSDWLAADVEGDGALIAATLADSAELSAAVQVRPISASEPT